MVPFCRLKYPPITLYRMSTNGPSDETRLPPNCPKCGKPLHVYEEQQFDIGPPEPSNAYLCYEHGFFTYDLRRPEAELLRLLLHQR